MRDLRVSNQTMDLTSSSRRRLPSSLTARFENKSGPKETQGIGETIEQKRTLDGVPAVNSSKAGKFEIQTEQEKPEVPVSNRTENGNPALNVCDPWKEIKGNGDYATLSEDATFHAKTANDTIQSGEAVTEHDFYSTSWSETDNLASNTDLVDETEVELEAKGCSEVWSDSGSKDFSSTWTDPEPFVTLENDESFNSEVSPGHILNFSENVESLPRPTSSIVRNDSISSDTKFIPGGETLLCNLASNENSLSLLEPWTCLDANMATSFELEPQSRSTAASEWSQECLDPGPDAEVNGCYGDIAEFDVDVLNEEVSDNELPSLQDVYQRCQSIRNKRFYSDMYSAWRQKTQEEAKEDALRILKSCGFCPADPDEVGEDLDAGLSLVPDRFWAQESKANEIFVEDMKAILEERKDAESRKQFQKYCATVERDRHRSTRRSAIALGGGGGGGGTSSLLFDCLKMNLLINCVPLYYFPSYLSRYLAATERQDVEDMD